VIEKGGSVEEALQLSLPAPFDAWSVDGAPGEVNVRTLYQRLSGGEGNG
jgi:hypothetical protein